MARIMLAQYRFCEYPARRKEITESDLSKYLQSVKSSTQARLIDDRIRAGTKHRETVQPGFVKCAKFCDARLKLFPLQRRPHDVYFPHSGQKLPQLSTSRSEDISGRYLHIGREQYGKD